MVAERFSPSRFCDFISIRPSSVGTGIEGFHRVADLVRNVADGKDPGAGGAVHCILSQMELRHGLGLIEVGLIMYNGRISREKHQLITSKHSWHSSIAQNHAIFKIARHSTEF